MNQFQAQVYEVMTFHWQEPKQIAEKLRSQGIKTPDLAKLVPTLWMFQNLGLLESRVKEDVTPERIEDRGGMRVWEYRKTVDGKSSKKEQSFGGLPQGA